MYGIPRCLEPELRPGAHQQARGFYKEIIIRRTFKLEYLSA